MTTDDGCVKVFGGTHPHLDSVPAPVGEPCFYCSEVIAEGERGFSQIFVEFVADCQRPRRIYLHRACFMRGITGSVAHIYRQCSCYIPEATEGDPPGMTKRQAAEAALAAWEAMPRHA